MPTRLPARFAALGTRLRQMHASPTPGAGVAFVLLLGGGGGYYGYNRYGGPGLGGALGLGIDHCSLSVVLWRTAHISC
jgi:hypothetical protein